MTKLSYYDRYTSLTRAALQEYIGRLFVKEGLTLEVIEISRLLDKYITEEQLDRMKSL